MTRHVVYTSPYGSSQFAQPLHTSILQKCLPHWYFSVEARVTRSDSDIVDERLIEEPCDGQDIFALLVVRASLSADQSVRIRHVVEHISYRRLQLVCHDAREILCRCALQFTGQRWLREQLLDNVYPRVAELSSESARSAVRRATLRPLDE